MRRFAAVLALLFTLFGGLGLPAGPARAEHPEITLQIHIYGGQFMYRYAGDLRHLPAVGGMFETTQALWGVAGFLGVPHAPPVYAFGYPAGFWPVVTITNHDPVRHQITQCGARWTEAECILVPDAYFQADLAPGQTKIWQPKDAELELLKGPQYLTDKQDGYRWMRGLMCFDEWYGLGNRACGNYARP